MTNNQHCLNKNPILLTGSNRSGSTWVGQVLANAPGVRYVHEPFNKVIAANQFNVNLPRWFLNAEDWDEVLLRRYIGRVLQPPLFDPKLKLGFLSQCKRIARLMYERQFPLARNWRFLLKDPVAIFSAAWLAREFPMNVVVLVRHPAAYVLSLLKDSRHMHPFAEIFGNQPNLLQRFSGDEIKLIEEVTAMQSRGGLGSDMVLEAAALWRLFHSQVLQYQKQFPDWIFLIYEELALNPMQEFECLCSDLGLEFSAEMQLAIQKTAMENDPSKTDTVSHVKRFDSKKNASDWEIKLDIPTKQRIAQITGEVGRAFYPDF